MVHLIMRFPKFLVYFISTTVSLIYITSIYNQTKYSSVTPPELIQKEGFPVESHPVTTKDGYILTVHRIPGAPGSTPVFLQHGLVESSIDWLYNGKNGSLAFLLHQAGYDVWLGNARGNTYSKQHKYLSPSDPAFWDFSWDEQGIYDNPAVISYIYKKTNEKLFYIGHSMGCTSFAVMAIERPDVAENIKAMFALAPAVYVKHSSHPLLPLLSSHWKELLVFSKQFNFHEILGRNALLNFFSDGLCSVTALKSLLCDNLLFFIGGFNRPEWPQDLTPHFWGNFPAGSSAKVFVQAFQQAQLAKLRRFNYPTAEENLKHYNSIEPPEYNISKIQVPVAVFYSHNDWLISAKDAERFYKEVPNKLGIYKVEPYNHFDFLIGLHAPERVFSRIFKLMNQFE